MCFFHISKDLFTSCKQSISRVTNVFQGKRTLVYLELYFDYVIKNSIFTKNIQRADTWLDFFHNHNLYFRFLKLIKVFSCKKQPLKLILLRTLFAHLQKIDPFLLLDQNAQNLKNPVYDSVEIFSIRITIWWWSMF